MPWRKNLCMFPRGDTLGWSHQPQPTLISRLETFSWSSCDWWRYNNYEKGKPWRHSCGQIRVFFACAQPSFLFDPTLSAFTSVLKTVLMLWSYLRSLMPFPALLNGQRITVLRLLLFLRTEAVY